MTGRRWCHAATACCAAAAGAGCGAVRPEARVVAVAHPAGVELRVLAGDAAAAVDNLKKLPPRGPNAVFARIGDRRLARWVAGALRLAPTTCHRRTASAPCDWLPPPTTAGLLRYPATGPHNSLPLDCFGTLRLAPTTRHSRTASASYDWLPPLATVGLLRCPTTVRKKERKEERKREFTHTHSTYTHT